MKRYQKILLVLLPLVLGLGIGAFLLSKPSRPRSQAPSESSASPETPLQSVRSEVGRKSGPAPGEIDLLARLELSRDAVHGSWGFQGGSLVSPSAQWARLSIPCIPPEEYDFRIVATRRQGTDSLNVGFLHGGRQGMLMVDGNGGETSWIDLVTPYDLSSNPTAILGKYLKWNRSTQVLVSVRKNGVGVSVDKTRIIDWTGEAAELKLIPGYRIPDRQRLFIGAWETVLLIEELTLIPVTGTPLFPQ